MNYLKLSLLFLALSLPFLASADPWDCMSKTEAEALKTYLEKNPFMLDYCDCCDDVAREYDNKKVKGYLVEIKSLEIVPCSWDAERYSVQVTEHKVWSSGYVERGTFEPDAKVDLADFPGADGPWPVAANYAYTLQKGKAVTLYKVNGMTDEKTDCRAPYSFPAPKAIKMGCWKKRKYRRFYKKRRK